MNEADMRQIINTLSPQAGFPLSTSLLSWLVSQARLTRFAKMFDYLRKLHPAALSDLGNVENK